MLFRRNSVFKELNDTSCIATLPCAKKGLKLPADIPLITNSRAITLLLFEIIVP
jgi:hypothetical protein